MKYGDCKPKVKIFNFWLAFFLFTFLLLNFWGCETVPVRDTLVGYDINGVRYLSLVALCDSLDIKWKYDTFTRSVTLRKDLHEINLMVGESLILVDGTPLHLKHAVDIYQGAVVVPYKFKEQVLDPFFKKGAPVPKETAAISKIKKIVIDAGHGGRDPGAIGKSGLREKDVNLDIAKRVAGRLRSEGIHIVMTRSTDIFVPLDDRVEKANSSGAELFVSIHANANHVRSLNGFEVYYVAPSVSDSKRAYASAQANKPKLENASFASSKLDLKAVVWDMIYTYSRAESIELSRSLCVAMDKKVGSRIIGIKTGRFEVLRGAQMPAVLIEVGYLSNRNEEIKLKNSYYRQKIAEAIVEGILDYSKDLQLAQAWQ